MHRIESDRGHRAGDLICPTGGHRLAGQCFRQSVEVVSIDWGGAVDRRERRDRSAGRTRGCRGVIGRRSRANRLADRMDRRYLARDRGERGEVQTLGPVHGNTESEPCFACIEQEDLGAYLFWSDRGLEIRSFSLLSRSESEPRLTESSIARECVKENPGRYRIIIG
jgi:hypothetical protein